MSRSATASAVTGVPDGHFAGAKRLHGRRIAGDFAGDRGFGAGNAINLEKSLRLSDRLGGHLVSGHVDGAGTVWRRNLWTPTGKS